MTMSGILGRAAVLGLLLGTGCGSTAESIIKAAPVGAPEQLFDASCDAVEPAAVHALETVGLAIKTRSREAAQRRLAAESPPNGTSWGEAVLVVVEPREQQCRVVVHTEKLSATNVTAKASWAPEVFAGIAADLAATPPIAADPALIPAGGPTATGCTKDTDCKGDRVCANGACTAP